MARLTFSNVPTASGGVVSGNISIGKGSPFGEGGTFEAKVANIQATIAQAPVGTYDPQYWDSFLQLDPEITVPIGYTFIPANSPSILAELQQIPQVRMALAGLQNIPPVNHRWSQDQFIQVAQQKKNYENEIAIHVNAILKRKNAPMIKAIEEQQKQLAIDEGVRLALEQKIRETAKPKKETVIIAPPEIVENPLSYTPLIIAGVIVVIVLFMWRRAK